MLPAVPPQVYRTERVYRDLLRIFEAIDKFLRSGARDRYAAMQAGLLDVAAAVNELVYGPGNLARQQRERRDELIGRAKEATLPQRRRRKVRAADGDEQPQPPQPETSQAAKSKTKNRKPRAQEDGAA